MYVGVYILRHVYFPHVTRCWPEGWPEVQPLEETRVTRKAL
jgi:hypothetical protein